MVTEHGKQEEIERQIAVSSSKSALLEKALLIILPLLFTGASYVVNEIHTASNEVLHLKERVAVVVSADNKAIPSQAAMLEIAQLKATLNDKIDKLDRDTAIARAGAVLDREKALAEVEKARLETVADAAQARMQIRLDVQKSLDEIDKRVRILEVLASRTTSGAVISIAQPIQIDWKPGDYSPDPKVQQWFRAQKNSVGEVCCDETEAVIVEDWAHDGDGYRVLINGQWYKVRKEAITASRSITGAPLAWIWPKGSPVSSQSIRCFISGPEG